MTGKIIEVFKSIQGEGKYAGTPQVFVRLFECNMHCTWCDTPHSIGDTTQNYRELSVEELMGEIIAHADGTTDISLTGGEPLLQTDFIVALTNELKEESKRVHLDTNGTLPDALQRSIHGVDVIAMDLKLPSSTEQKEYWEEHEDFIQIARDKDLFIKTVVSLNTSEEDIVRARDIVAEHAPETLFIIQPNTFDLGEGIISKCTLFEQICSSTLKNVRILPQMHKMLKVR